MPGECKPELYMTRSEHDKHCDDRHDGAMEWAHDVVKASEADRTKLWQAIDKLFAKVDDLKDLVPKFQWWFIGILAVVILSNIVIPKIFPPNGSKELKEAQQNIVAIESKQARHEGISAKNQQDLQLIMKKLGVKE
jgi:hypothetical protein